MRDEMVDFQNSVTYVDYCMHMYTRNKGVALHAQHCSSIRRGT